MTALVRAKLPGVTLAEVLRDAERRAVAEALAQADGLLDPAARALGVNRRTLNRMVVRHELRDRVGDARKILRGREQIYTR